MKVRRKVDTRRFCLALTWVTAVEHSLKKALDPPARHVLARVLLAHNPDLCRTYPAAARLSFSSPLLCPMSPPYPSSTSRRDYRRLTLFSSSSSLHHGLLHSTVV